MNIQNVMPQPGANAGTVISELENYLSRLEDLRRQMMNLLRDLPPGALNWRPLQGNAEHATNSLAVLAVHSAGAEHFWIAEVIGGQPPSRRREMEFAVVATSAEEILQVLEKTAAETRRVCAALQEADLNTSRRVEGRQVAVRWCFLHVVDHTALHLGHMQMTYQLWAGGRSVPSPMWFERLP